MTLRPALALAFALAACGASAGPGPAPADDAAADNAPADAADARACGDREAMVGGQCVPATDTMCGPERRACVAPQRCIVDGAPDGGLIVHCDTL